jgi:hypothetical protein
VIDRLIKTLPFALITLITVLLISYAFGGVTAGQLFRGLLAACSTFILFIVLTLWLRPSKPTPPVKPSPWSFIAEGPIAKGDLVIVATDGKHVFSAMDDKIKPLNLPPPPGGTVQ